MHWLYLPFFYFVALPIIAAAYDRPKSGLGTDHFPAVQPAEFSQICCEMVAGWPTSFNWLLIAGRIATGLWPGPSIVPSFAALRLTENESWFSK